MKIIFFGTPTFAANVLDFLLKHNIEVAAVVTKPDRPKGRSKTPLPTPVKVLALAHTPPLPVHQPEIVSAIEFASTLKAYKADLFVVAAYGEIIKQHVLDMPPLGCINVHASLLPKYRGAAPIQHAIINGEKESGAAIMHMAKKMDAGDIIKMVKVTIDEEMTAGELEAKICEAGSQALLEVLREYEKGAVPPRYPQDADKATFAPKIELEGCWVDWTKTAQEMHNLVRGVNPEPGAWCFIKVKGEKKRLKLFRTKVEPDLSGPPGTILEWNGKGAVVACQTLALRLLEVQLEGKKRMNAEVLARGLPPSDISFFDQNS